jgi:aryl-alcohol dehydrogenase-like predicted oxidoreductase
MTKRPFGRTGLSVSPLGFGAAPAAFLDTDQQRLADMLGQMLDAGVNVIDTAAAYPGSEAFIGKYLSPRRKEFVLISKCGTKVEGIDAPPWSKQLISQSVDRALKALKTDVIDVMLLHSCDLPTLQKGEAMGALIEAREAGKIRFAGYSGDNEAVAVAAAMPDVAVVEMSISVADQKNIDLGLAAARKHNVGVLAKRPVANAAWKDLNQQPGMYKNYAKDYTQRLAQMNISPAGLGLGGSPDQAWPELALRFALSQAGVSTAIIGTTNPKNALANVEASNKGPLPQEVVEQIRAAFRKADPKGEWQGLT